MTSMDLGPAELITLIFPGERAHPGVAEMLAQLAAGRDIRLLDLVFVIRTSGDVVQVTGDRENLEEIGLGAVQVSAPKLISEDDLGVVRDWLRPGTSAAVIAYEHTWARRLARAVRDAGGMVMLSRSSGRLDQEQRVADPLTELWRCVPVRQFLHLLLGEVEPYPVVQGVDGADRYGNLFVAPQMALAEQDVGHPVIGGIHGEALQPADPAIDGMNVLMAADFAFTLGDSVADNDRRADPQAGADVAVPHGKLRRTIAAAVIDALGPLDFLGRFELAELGEATAQPDLACSRFDKLDRHQPATRPVMPGFDDQMRHPPGGRVEDGADDLAA